MRLFWTAVWSLRGDFNPHLLCHILLSIRTSWGLLSHAWALDIDAGGWCWVPRLLQNKRRDFSKAVSQHYPHFGLQSGRYAVRGTLASGPRCPIAWLLPCQGTLHGICYQVLNTLPFHLLSLPCPTVHTFHKASLRSVTLNTSLTSTADVCRGDADNEILGTFQKRAWLLSFLKIAFLFPLLGSGWNPRTWISF